MIRTARLYYNIPTRKNNIIISRTSRAFTDRSGGGGGTRKPEGGGGVEDDRAGKGPGESPGMLI